MKACLLMASAAALGLASAASAHEVETKERKQVRTVVIHKDAHVMAHSAQCEDAVVTSDVDVETPAADGKKQRTRILICNSEKDVAKARAQALAALEKARDRLSDHESDRLSAEHRAKALAALEAEIARLRAQ